MEKEKTVFDILEDNFNISETLNLIYQFTFKMKIFKCGYYDLYTFEEIFNFVIKNWRQNKTLCVSTTHMLYKVSNGLNIEKFDSKQLNNPNVFLNLKNYLEVLYNMFFEIKKKLYEPYKKTYFELYDKTYFASDDFDYVFNLIKLLINHLLLTTHITNEWIFLKKNDNLTEQILPKVKESIQIQIIKYKFETNLTEKRKILCIIATDLKIEKKEEFYPNYKKDTILFHYLDNSTAMLNNLNIRHPNEKVKGITDKEMNKLCDALFNQMLMLVFIKENKDNEELIKECRTKFDK